MLNSKYQLAVPVNKEDHISGNPATAKITLVEYGDYECPYCGRAYPVVKQLQEDFGSDLAFVFRNFPLTQMHPHAFHAAEAAEIASDDGKFWEMHDMIYENQSNLSDLSLHVMAKNIGLNTEKFDEDMKNETKADRVKSDFISGVESGVNGTPSFFVNGQKYDGDWSYIPFKAFLEQFM